MNLLELVDISYIYHSLDGETEAIKEVNLTVREGEFTAIVGPSGSGKTTLLKIMAGLIAPSKGSIEKPKDVRVSYMPQRDQLFEWRSILKNVTLSAEIGKHDRAAATAYATELLDKYGLGEFKKKRPSALSGGMRQRAALIRTLVSNPQLTLLDEPFSALDFQTRLYVSDDVWKILSSEKKSCVMVTHDISEAISFADTVVLLTKRPATVKAVYKIDLDRTAPPTQRREQRGFSEYFKTIFSDMEVGDE